MLTEDLGLMLAAVGLVGLGCQSACLANEVASDFIFIDRQFYYWSDYAYLSAE